LALQEGPPLGAEAGVILPVPANPARAGSAVIGPSRRSEISISLVFDPPKSL